MKVKKKFLFPFAAVCGVVLCGFIVLRIFLSVLLYSASGKIKTFPAASQSYVLTYEITRTEVLSAQAERLYRQAQAKYQEVFGVTLDEETRAGEGYDGNWYEGYFIQMMWVVWQDGWEAEKGNPYQAYDAYFVQQSAQSAVELTELSFWGNVDSGAFDGYINEARNSIVNRLGREIPQAYPVMVRVAYICETDDVEITIAWKPEMEAAVAGEDPFFYRAVYENCDLESGAGRIKSLSAEPVSPVFKPVLFSPQQREAAIQTLRRLAEAEQISLGEVTEQKTVPFTADERAMVIAFAMQEEDTRILSFTIGADGTLFGYAYKTKQP